ncbi:MAG: hypothetical protein DMG13_33255 [Acidobacteria bacterium]|nr:MAG: hypothetical protein DMG13_33255 [Acidobacteriota bacterium]
MRFAFLRLRAIALALRVFEAARYRTCASRTAGDVAVTDRRLQQAQRIYEAGGSEHRAEARKWQKRPAVLKEQYRKWLAKALSQLGSAHILPNASYQTPNNDMIVSPSNRQNESNGSDIVRPGSVTVMPTYAYVLSTSSYLSGTFRRSSSQKFFEENNLVLRLPRFRRLDWHE